MAYSGPSVTLTAPTAGRRALRAMLVAGFAVQAAACASAAVENVAKHDAATTGGAGGTGGSGGKGGAGGAGGTGGASTTTTGVCDPFSSSGCSSGQKCTALQIEKTLQLGCGSKGNRAAGENCTPAATGDDCGDGLACFRLATETTPTCRRICAPAASTCACATGEICSLVVTGLDSLGYAFCRPVVGCHPLDQTGCSDASTACYFTTSSCYTGPQCAQKGSKAPGSACGAANECTPGSTCLLVGSGICSSFCSTADGGTPKCAGASTGGDICDPLGGPDANLGSCRQQP